MKKRIENKTSRTAEMNCLIRALSYRDKDKHFSSDDWVAPLLLPDVMKALCGTRLLRALQRRMGVRGMYEYIIARTKHIDALFEKYAGESRQALVFGAGFDSRFVRFKDKLGDAACFELDSLLTQEAKKAQYEKRGVATPANVTYIPIDFLKESVADKLTQHGFKKGLKSIIVLEGLTMYLDDASMNETFEMLSVFAGEESVVVFDYVHSDMIEQKGSFIDERKIRRQLEKLGEQWTFGFNEGAATEFLSRHGFTAMDEADSLALESRYMEGMRGIINDTHVIVTAQKSG